MLNQETSKEQVCIWIIRFADYTLASFFGYISAGSGESRGK